VRRCLVASCPNNRTRLNTNPSVFPHPTEHSSQPQKSQHCIMNNTGNQLCALCQGLFSSPVRIYHEDDGLNLRPRSRYIHYQSYDELVYSARHCHLCLIISEALLQVSVDWTSDGPVQLYFEARGERKEPDLMVSLGDSVESLPLEIRSNTCKLLTSSS
jgi:hypothetical protein